MSYRYNGHGERVYRSGSGQTAYTLFDPAGHWIGDYDENGEALQQAIWLGGRGPSPGQALPVGLLARHGGETRLYHIEADALGTPRAVIDPTRGTLGTVVWRWDLSSEAFGEDAPNEDPDGDGIRFVLDLRFPGQQYDSASGLNYNYFRDYEPSVGRYVQSDPIGLAGGMSTYGYVGGDPLAYSDQYGLQRTLRSLPMNSPSATSYRLDDPEFQRDFGNLLETGAWNGVSILLGNPYIQSVQNALLAFSKMPRSLTPNQQKFWRRYCAGTDDPCNAIKTAVMQAISMARKKQSSMFLDDRKLYLHAFATPNRAVTGTNTTWLNHSDDLDARILAIQEMIAVGKAMGCDMSNEERLASYIFVPKKTISPIAMRRNVDFSIFIGPEGSYGVITGVLEVPGAVTEGGTVSISSGSGGNILPPLDGFDGQLKVEKIVFGTDLGIEDTMVFEDLVLGSEKDAEILVGYLESEFDLFFIRNGSF